MEEYNEEVIKWTCKECKKEFFLPKNIGMAVCDCGAEEW